MEKKKTGIKRKIILICTAVLLAAALIFFFIFFVYNNVDTDKFNENLNNKNYEKAYKAYSRAESEYEETLDLYLKNILEGFNNSGTPSYEETLQTINDLLNNGFSGTIIDDYTNQIQTLQLSKQTYESADTMFSEHNIVKAKEQYAEVIDWDINYADAQNKIAEIEELISTNEDDYLGADALYLENELESALTAYQTIVDSQINTADAEAQVNKINDIISAWDAEFTDGYLKSTYSYQVTTKDNIMYIPYTYKETHCIIKYNIVNDEMDTIAIARMPGIYVIDDINTVGDYLYFIGGENVGNGRMLDNPYNIYRMKNDGTDLECVALGDYSHLIAYKDGFYASTYTNGIVKLDRNLKFVEQIYEDSAIQMQLFEGKLYFTSEVYNRYRTIYAEFSYDGSELVEIRQKRNLRFAIFPGIEIFSYRVGDDYTERIIAYDMQTDKTRTIIQDDFIGLYGLIDGKIVCNKEKRSGMLTFNKIDIANKVTELYISRIPSGIIKFQNICYDNKTLLFTSATGFIVTDQDYNFIKNIDIPLNEIENMALNNEMNFLHDDSEYFTEEEVIIQEDNFWFFSDPEYNIRVEKRYSEDYDTSMYICHVHTNNDKFISVDSPYEDTYITRVNKYPEYLARQYDAVLALNGDFFSQNYWTGISIRKGIVYKNTLIEDMAAIYPDGSLVCYEKGDDITSEKLIEAGVQDTFSFGPVIISDYQYGSQLYSHFLAIQNPRTAIGMIEPGHYVAILVDGRQPNCAGVTFRSLADIFSAEGCSEVYNLDGGQSATIMFMGSYLNAHYLEQGTVYFRALPEIVYFGTSEQVPEEEPLY